MLYVHSRRSGITVTFVTSCLAACVSTKMVPFQVTSEPPGGNIEVNGVHAGVTPCEVGLQMTERFVGLANAPGGWQAESPFYEVTVFPPHLPGQVLYSQTKRVLPSMTPKGASLYFDLRLVPAFAQAPPAPAPAKPPNDPPAEPGFTISSGTAFLVDPHHVLTALHVVESATEVWICLGGENRTPCQVVARDQANDLCLLKLERPVNAAPLRFCEPGALQVGEKVFLLGFPLSGILEHDGASISDGIVSGMRGLHGDMGAFQMTAPTNQGNSGGPVIDASGNVVGVLLSTLSPYYMLKNQRTVPQGVNFAVRSDIVLALMRDSGAHLQTSKELSAPMDGRQVYEATASRVFMVRASRTRP